MSDWNRYDGRVTYVVAGPHSDEIYICFDGKFHSWGVLKDGFWCFQTIEEPNKITQLHFLDYWFVWGMPK